MTMLLHPSLRQPMEVIFFQGSNIILLRFMIIALRIIGLQRRTASATCNGRKHWAVHKTMFHAVSSKLLTEDMRSQDFLIPMTGMSAVIIAPLIRLIAG